MGVGGVAALLALGQAAEGTLLGTAAGMAFMAAARFLPEPFRFSGDGFPKLRAMGWRPVILSPDQGRMLRKLDLDFANSPLPGKAEVLDDLGHVHAKALRFGSDRADMLTNGLERLGKEYDPPPDVSWVGVPKPVRLEPFASLTRPLSISCSVIEPAVWRLSSI